MGNPNLRPKDTTEDVRTWLIPDWLSENVGKTITTSGPFSTSCPTIARWFFESVRLLEYYSWLTYSWVRLSLHWTSPLTMEASFKNPAHWAQHWSFVSTIMTQFGTILKITLFRSRFSYQIIKLGPPSFVYATMVQFGTILQVTLFHSQFSDPVSWTL